MSRIPLLSDGSIYFPDENGNFVSENQRRIGEILNDYDPTLQLQWIPPGARNEKDEPFRVVHFPPNRSPYLICTAQEADERLLAKVFQADAKNRSGSAITFIDAYNSAIQIANAKKMEEKRNEAHELAASILRSPKIHYRHGGIDFERLGRSDSGKTYIWR